MPSTDLHNLTNLTDSSNFVQLTQEVNQLTGELFGFLVLISFFVILFAVFKNQPTNVRIVTAAFLTTIVSFLFRVIDMTGDLVVLVFVLITAGAYVAMYYGG